jgi:hypothetical protein
MKNVSSEDVAAPEKLPHELGPTSSIGALRGIEPQ